VRRVTSRTILALAAVFVVFSLASTAKAADVVARFPDPRQVAGDYPDPVQRYVAFEVLEHEINRDAPRPQSPTAYQKTFAYGAGYNALENAARMKGLRSPDYEQWAKARDTLLNDMEFRRSVLSRYGLGGLPALGRPPPPGTVVNQPPAPLTNKQILWRAFYRALPVTLPCFVLMFVLPWIMISASGVKQSPKSLPANFSPMLPPLPESLRVIRLGAVHYPIISNSGIILDIQTKYIARTTYYLANQIPSTNPANAYNQVPTSSTELIRCDHLRVRTVHMQEVAWVLYGGGVDVFVGQTISVVMRQRKDKLFDILMVYNHNTNMLGPQNEQLGDAHRARGLFSQTISFFLGVLPCTALASMAVASGIENLINVSMEYFEVMMVPGSICSLTIAFFWTRWLKYRIPLQRNRQLFAKYGPGFAHYFAECTPVIRRILG
jgi:hypothetical protein